MSTPSERPGSRTTDVGSGWSAEAALLALQAIRPDDTGLAEVSMVLDLYQRLWGAPGPIDQPQPLLSALCEVCGWLAKVTVQVVLLHVSPLSIAINSLLVEGVGQLAGGSRTEVDRPVMPKGFSADPHTWAAEDRQVSESDWGQILTRIDLKGDPSAARLARHMLVDLQSAHEPYGASPFRSGRPMKGLEVIPRSPETPTGPRVPFRSGQAEQGPQSAPGAGSIVDGPELF